MKVVYIVPGFGGSFYCQNCISSLNLVNSLREQDHEAVLVPMYMPLRMDMPVEPDAPIFYGAINIYLEEKFPFLRHMPLWVENIFNSKILLNWVTKNSASTSPAGLEEMTISVMKGEDGIHKAELEHLVRWLKDSVCPDVIHLSNALLIGIAVRIKKELNIPVFCNLDDENFWLDNMREPYSSIGWDLIREGANTIDGFISASRFYSELVRKKIDIPAEKIHVIPKGVFLKKFVPGTPSFDPPVIGFLSRMAESRGLGILVDAFILLKEDGTHQDLKLRISGGMAPQDKKFIRMIKKKLKRKGLYGDVEIDPYLYQKDINKFYESLTVTSVPVPGGEAFGTFMLESMASGIPVVQPKAGGYPEIISNTGGGIVYEENTYENLAEVLSGLLNDPGKIIQMSHQGLDSIYKHYSAQKITGDLLKIYKS